MPLVGDLLSSLFLHISVVSILFLRITNFPHLAFEVFTARIQTAHPPPPHPSFLQTVRVAPNR